MEVNIFILLISFMLNIIQESKCTGPKGFLLGSDVFIYASLTILTIELNRISAESLLSWVYLCSLPDVLRRPFGVCWGSLHILSTCGPGYTNLRGTDSPNIIHYLRRKEIYDSVLLLFSILCLLPEDSASYLELQKVALFLQFWNFLH